ncbi:hypothetical protein CIB48_g2184 [Xylaria polymorpha]|nr:hypothetical protein CIB48_g2184 [Xylaria polymorpha]
MLLLHFLTFIFVATTPVVARKCLTGGIYCGRYLLKAGDYVTRITTHLRASNLTTEDYNIENSLWACIHHGDITFVDMCWFGCVGGTKRDDFCAMRVASAEGDDELAEGG